MVVTKIIFRFERELAFGLEEKPDRITCHPALRSLEGQDVVYLPGEHLAQGSAGDTRKRHSPAV